MQRQTLKKFAVPATLVALLFLVSGCLDILQIIQPSSVLPGASFTATIEVALDETGCGCPGGGPSAGLVALLIPTDFTVNSIEYDGDYGPEFMDFLDPDSADIQPGAGTDFWYDSLMTYYPPPAGMDWYVYQGPLQSWIGTDTNYVSVTVEMTAGAAGQFDLGYFASTADYNFGSPTETSISLGHALTVGTVGIEDDRPQLTDFALEQNYPNPFNPSTTIRYSVKTSSDVKLTVFDVSGKEVAQLVKGTKEAGSYEVNFDATNLTSGVYVYRLTAGNYSETRKMMLVR